ncbi:hypothetical protein K0M31_010093 [Melipona bicolor]|uniref:Uncharacterized protein n=1 Tax=Melipona bicolor TaxID=60889 RepID=A0AA40KIQ0_9HYME|nr:hypothetical protein K0M31_010093 [Melipona bicolor]
MADIGNDTTSLRARLLISQQWGQRIRPFTSHFAHLRATNSAVKSLRWTDLLLPLQTGHSCHW